jgi:probable F420-dependent oxidoreductase
MKVGVMFANVVSFATPGGAKALAAAAENAGVESLWTVEHVVVPEGYASPYPYSPTGKMPGDERAPIPDPLAWLSYMAALTTNVRLATGILILPQRNPVVLAKECATIDVLSGGRLTLGIGIGWLKEEFDAIGIPFDERTRRTDEYVRALRALWSVDETHDGEFASFANARSYPKPVQDGGIPIVVGGHTKGAARRAGRLGDGFFPARAENLSDLLDEMRRAAKDAGRDPDAIEVTTGGPPSVDFAKQLADQGVTRIVMPPPSFAPDDIGRALGELSESFISKVSSL